MRPAVRPRAKSEVALLDAVPSLDAESPAGRTDAELVAAYRGGDPSAFEAIFTRYSRRIAGMCWTYLHDASLAEDLVQETFCRLIEGVDRVDTEFNVSAWLHRIAVNLCLDELRRRKRRRAADAGPGDHEMLLLKLVDPDRRKRPEEALDLACTQTQVWEAVERVPERQRRVLVLRDVQGHTHHAIATRLELAPGAVQGILHRARERFKQEYVAIDGAEPATGECAKVGYLLRTMGGRGLRLDRLKSVRGHVRDCPSCLERFGDPQEIGLSA